jgi:hypothetical protein
MKNYQKEQIRNLSLKNKMKYLSKTDQDVLNDIIMVSFSKVYVAELNRLKEDNIIFQKTVKLQANTLLTNLDKSVQSYISKCAPESQVQYNVLANDLLIGFQNVLLNIRDVVKFASSIEEVQEDIINNKDK